MRLVLALLLSACAVTPTDAPSFLLTASGPTADVVASCSGGVCTFDATGSTGWTGLSWRYCPTCTAPQRLGEAQFQQTLSPKTRTWLLIVDDGAAFDTLAFTFTSPHGPGWPVVTPPPPPPPPASYRHITAGGCSNTERVFRVLNGVSGYPRPTPGFRKDSLPGGTIARYLRLDPEKSWNDRWMEGVRTFQPTGDVYWFQICLGTPELIGEEVARAAQVADSLVRYRAEAVFIFSGLGSNPDGSCTWADFPRTEWVADSLVARGYGIRGPSVALVRADMEPDGCHPGPSGRTKWSDAVRAFVGAL